MTTYRVTEEDDEPGIGFQIIFYAIMFTILLPIGVIYLIVKMIIWLVRRHKNKKLARELAARHDEEVRAEEENRRRAMHAETTERMLRLRTLYDKGLLSPAEFEDLMSREKANLYPAETRLQGPR